MRLGVYTDYQYHEADGRIYAERAFALFIVRVGANFDHLTVMGRLSPSGGNARYPVGDDTRFVPLPFYRSLSEPISVARTSLTMTLRFWRALPELDVVWMLGPHPFVNLFALIAALRGKRVVLGVRQDTVEYVKARHPSSRMLPLIAVLLDWSFRMLGRFMPVVAVGPQIAERYRGAGALLETSVSLVEESEIVPVSEAIRKDYGGELQLLSVGRLESEKNPLLLADALALLNKGERRWRLVICGEGPMEQELRARVRELGLENLFELRGYVPLDGGLVDIYRSSHAFLHVSRTEGLPQVLLESFAAGTPVVATDVGGVAEAVGEAALVVPPDDPAAVAERLTRLAADPETRERLLTAGHEFVSVRTVSRESERVARFLAGS